jgi:hypothetical protein
MLPAADDLGILEVDGLVPEMHLPDGPQANQEAGPGQEDQEYDLRELLPVSAVAGAGLSLLGNNWRDRSLLKPWGSSEQIFQSGVTGVGRVGARADNARDREVAVAERKLEAVSNLDVKAASRCPVPPEFVMKHLLFAA